jgi:serine/threonine protein kinase
MKFASSLGNLEYFKPIRSIGSGTYGHVLHALFLIPSRNVSVARDTRTDMYVALKRIERDKAAEVGTAVAMQTELDPVDHPARDHDFETTITPQRRAVTRRRHSSKSLPLSAASHPPEFELGAGELYMVFEFVQNDLAGIVASKEYNLTKPQVRFYMKQLLSGIAYCHAQNVIHRDIKCTTPAPLPPSSPQSLKPPRR